MLRKFIEFVKNKATKDINGLKEMWNQIKDPSQKPMRENNILAFSICLIADLIQFIVLPIAIVVFLVMVINKLIGLIALIAFVTWQILDHFRTKRSVTPPVSPQFYFDVVRQCIFDISYELSTRVQYLERPLGVEDICMREVYYKDIPAYQIAIGKSAEVADSETIKVLKKRFQARINARLCANKVIGVNCPNATFDGENPYITILDVADCGTYYDLYVTVVDTQEMSQHVTFLRTARDTDNRQYTPDDQDY